MLLYWLKYIYVKYIDYRDTLMQRLTSPDFQSKADEELKDFKALQLFMYSVGE